MEEHDHKAAFPLVIPAPGFQNVEVGMALRDWFAGQALSGIASRNPVGSGEDQAEVVAAAYSAADAMMVARAPKAPAEGDDDAS